MRRCIFCGGGPVSKEHVWALWLTDVLGFARFRVEADRPSGLMPSREAVSIDKQARVVCTRCNNGWMNNLEGSVRPLITRLITDPNAEVQLSAEQLTVIAAWVVKCAMVLEYASPGSRQIYTQEQRRFLMDNLMPPDNVTVWLAKYRGERTLHDTVKYLKSADSLFRGQTTTVVIGHLGLQVMTGSWPTARAGRVRSDDHERWATYLVQVWPLPDRASRWPPSQTVTDADLVAFTDRFLTGISLVETRKRT